MMKSLETFGKRLKEARLRKGLTQQELAEKIGGGLSYGVIGHYENARRPPRLDQIQEMSRVLEVDMAWLMGDSDFMKKYANIEKLLDVLVETGYLKEGEDIDQNKVKSIMEAIRVIKKASI